MWVSKWVCLRTCRARRGAAGPQRLVHTLKLLLVLLLMYRNGSGDVKKRRWSAQQPQACRSGHLSTKRQITIRLGVVYPSPHAYIPSPHAYIPHSIVETCARPFKHAHRPMLRQLPLLFLCSTSRQSPQPVPAAPAPAACTLLPRAPPPERRWNSAHNRVRLTVREGTIVWRGRGVMLLIPEGRVGTHRAERGAELGVD